jgi:Uncharacterized ACR, COG1430
MKTHLVTLRGQLLTCFECETDDECTRGLVGSTIDDTEAMLLPGDSGLHTIGVPMMLDIVWIDDAGNTVAIDERVPVGRIIQSKAAHALELAGGWFQRHPRTKGCCDGCASGHGCGGGAFSGEQVLTVTG